MNPQGACFTNQKENEVLSNTKNTSFINEAMNHLHAMNEHCIVCTTDADGIITRVNDNFCRLTGYEQHEVIGEKHSLFSSNYHPEEFYQALWQTISSGNIWNGEVKNINKQGEPIWLKTTIVPHLDHNGTPYSYTTIRTDITDLKSAEEAIRESTERTNIRRDFFLSLLGNTTLLHMPKQEAFEELARNTCTIRHIDRLHFWQYKTRTGEFECMGFFSKTENSQQFPRTVKDYWNISECNFSAPLIYNSLENCTFDFERAYFTDNNIAMQIIIPVRSDNHISGLIVCEQFDKEAWNEENTVLLIALAPYTMFLIEYHKQKEIKQQLLESEMRLSLSQNFASIGTWDWRIDSGELYWSDKIASLFGYHESIPETTYENFLNAVHPDDRTYVQDAVAACVYDNVPYNIEHRVVWEDGTERWLHESGGTIKDANGKPVRMLGVVRDITEHILADQALIKSKEAADKANQAKSEFLSRMSHELRTPLNAILGFTQLLQLDAGVRNSTDLNSFAKEIYNASNHLLHLINEVLDLSLVESGNIELDIGAVEINSLLRECSTLTLPLFSKRNISLTTNYHNNTDCILADRTRTKQVIVNLLSNAAKYSNSNDQVILGYESTDPGSWRIFVKDNGPGISPHNQIKLFGAFNRLDKENSLIEGTGIGLALSKDLVEVMKGKIGCDSDTHSGSTFWFELPSTSGSVSASTKTRFIKEYVSDNFDEKLKVLYIEDNPANMLLVTKIFETEDKLLLMKATDAGYGLELAYHNQPDLILLDLQLPTLDGFEVLKRLRVNALTKNIPVIAITANAMRQDYEKCMAAGFDDYLTKPFDIKEFLLKIYTHITG